MSEETSTIAAVADSFTEERALAAAHDRGEPEWLLERRTEASRAFAATPLPTPALRPWRYTDVTALDLDAFPPAETPIEVEAPKELPISTIAEAIEGDSAEVVREHLGALIGGTEGKFLAANAAWWSGGALVHIPRNVALKAPVIVTIDAGALADASIFPRLLIVAEERAEGTIVLRLRSGDAPLLVAGIVEIFTAQASRVRLVVDQRWGATTQDFTTVRSRLGRDADVQVATLNIGGRIVKQTVEALIDGEGANSTIRSVALGDSDQHFDFVTLQDHVGPRSTSDVEVKAALAGASRSIYYGITRVEETAAGSHAEQMNNNLLLSKHAKADSDPVLEILTADVIRCGHGATVGPVDEEAMFYLQSRGLARRPALQLLVNGFFQSVLGNIDLPGVAEELEAMVFEKLDTAEL